MSFTTLQGIAAAGGVAIGQCLLYDPTPPLIPQNRIESAVVPAEKDRLDQAIRASVEELAQLRDHVQSQIGSEEAAIFDAHLLILEDEALLEGVHQRIEAQLMNAEQALWDAAEEFARMLAELEDSYFQARATDIHDIRTRVIYHLQGRQVPNLRHVSSPVIVVAHDLLPSDTAGLNPRYVLGLVTEQGGPTSHTAILARQLRLPAVVGVKGLFATLKAAGVDGTSIALNGSNGKVVVNPDAATITQYEEELQQYREQKQQLETLRTLPAVTLDGIAIEIAANIGRPQDAAPALEAGAGGVGLFRTEFLFLDRTTPPTEEEQFEAYSAVLKIFAEKTVIMRTLDIGGDKTIPYLSLAPESNPFLGLRGIRLCLAEPYQHLFCTQVRALLRAAEAVEAGSLWVMFPMISDLRELRQAKAFLAKTEADLLKDGGLKSPVLPKIRQGIMVEVPAAALLTDVLAQEADFFSIGTNDLAQYTLASDRMNANLAELHRPFHPAVMRSIAHIITTARKCERWVGMCGEMAGNPQASLFLLGLGINELSMESASFNAVKHVLRSTTMNAAQQIVERVLAAETAVDIEEILTKIV